MNTPGVEEAVRTRGRSSRRIDAEPGLAASGCDAGGARDGRRCRCSPATGPGGGSLVGGGRRIWPLRRVLEFNERLAIRGARAVAARRRFPRSCAQAPRVNGIIGMAAGRRQSRARRRRAGVTDVGGRRGTRSFRLDDLRALPRSSRRRVQVHRGLEHRRALGRRPARRPRRGQGLGSGVGSAIRPDVAPPGDLLPYVGMATPDGDYYVGLDTPSALHPQTLLCYEMNGHGR